MLLPKKDKVDSYTLNVIFDILTHIENLNWC